MRRSKSLVNLVLCFAIALLVAGIIGVSPATQYALANEGGEPGGISNDSASDSLMPPIPKINEGISTLEFMLILIL